MRIVYPVPNKPMPEMTGPELAAAWDRVFNNPVLNRYFNVDGPFVRWFARDKPDIGQRDPASESDSAEEGDSASSDGSEPNSSDSETEEIRAVAEQIELEDPDAEARENDDEDANENDNVVADGNDNAEEAEEDAASL